jgi:hypothetical protein
MDCRTRLRGLFDSEPETIADGARRLVEFLFQEFVDDDGNPASALVRIFKTHRYSDLPEELQRFAQTITPEVESIPNVRCLTLVATEGLEPAWQSPERSLGHRCIPLTSETMVEQAPMISQLIKQLGLSVSSVIRPAPGMLLDASESYNVFYVPEALGSPYIVAQDEFVVPYGIASVIGFGGLVASGDLFAAIMFSKVHVSAAVADLFKVIGLNMKLLILPFARKPLF